MSKASAYFTVDNLSNKHDIKQIKRELDTLSGVISVSVSNQSGNIAVDFDTSGLETTRIEKKIKDLGYHVIHSKLENHIM